MFLTTLFQIDANTPASICAPDNYKVLSIRLPYLSVPGGSDPLDLKITAKLAASPSAARLYFRSAFEFGLQADPLFKATVLPPSGASNNVTEWGHSKLLISDSLIWRTWRQPSTFLAGESLRSQTVEIIGDASTNYSSFWFEADFDQDVRVTSVVHTGDTGLGVLVMEEFEAAVAHNNSFGSRWTLAPPSGSHRSWEIIIYYVVEEVREYSLFFVSAQPQAKWSPHAVFAVGHIVLTTIPHRSLVCTGARGRVLEFELQQR